MAADTQETVGDEKNYVEKIEVNEESDYPLAIGGAGAEDIIKPFSQELMERVKDSKPDTVNALRLIVKETIKEVYEKDVPLLVLERQYRSPNFIIAAKPPNDDFCIIPVTGKRIYKEAPHPIIGYPTAYNHALLKRMYREQLPMQQAVMLAVYLLSQSKKFDDGVSGDTSIVIVTDKNAYREEYLYSSQIEKSALNFLKITDNIFLASGDSAISQPEFDKILNQFKDELLSLHATHIDRVANFCGLMDAIKDKNLQKLPLRTPIYFSDEGILTVEHDSEKIRQEQERWAKTREIIESNTVAVQCTQCGKVRHVLLETKEEKPRILQGPCPDCPSAYQVEWKHDS